MGYRHRNIGIFLESNYDKIVPVGLELIGKTIEIMEDRPYKLHAILATNQADKISESQLEEIKSHVDEIFIDEYDQAYLSTEHYSQTLCEYVKAKEPKILLLGATPLGRSFGPRVAAHFKTGITADCTEIQYDEELGLVQTRPAYGEELLAEIVTPSHFPQMATIRPGIMNPPARPGDKDAIIMINKRELAGECLTILDRQENPQEINLNQAKLVVIAGNAIKEKEDLMLVKKLAEALGGEYGVTRPLIEGGLAPHTRQVGVSGNVLAASIVILLGVSGSNQTLAGIEKAKKIIAINNNPDARVFEKVDIGIIDDWKDFTIDMLNEKGMMVNE